MNKREIVKDIDHKFNFYYNKKFIDYYKTMLLDIVWDGEASKRKARYVSVLKAIYELYRDCGGLD